MTNFFSKLAVKLSHLQDYLLSYSERQLFLQNGGSAVHRSFRLGKHNTIFISPAAIIRINENASINEHNFITVKSGAHFSVGRETYITRATISCLERVEIGENCILGEGLKIFDHNHQHSHHPFSVSKTEFNTAPVTIGNNVWSGANCIILKGVRIGDNVILGAGCVIFKDVPANTIVTNHQNLQFRPF